MAGLDPPASDLLGWVRGQTSAQSHQPGKGLSKPFEPNLDSSLCLSSNRIMSERSVFSQSKVNDLTGLYLFSHHSSGSCENIQTLLIDQQTVVS